MKADVKHIDTIKIANEDLEAAKKFKVASQYLIPWISGRNFLFNYVKFGPYKRRIFNLSQELK